MYFNFVFQFVLSNSAKDVMRLTKRGKVATVTIALIQALGLEAMADEKRLLFCRFR
jgi:hypothetical protein